MSPRRADPLPLLLLGQALAGYGLACLCFLLGVPLGGWQYGLSVALAVAAGLRVSRRTGLLLLALNAVILLLTLQTFTYVHCDASICHVPMAQFMTEGWNPVREATPEAVRACFARHGLPGISAFDVRHILAAPKFAQILSAQVQAALGLFTAGGYPLWTVLLALALTAYRFARASWAAGAGTATAFAVILCANPVLLPHVLGGLVDGVAYGSLATAALAFLLWHAGRRPADLATFFVSLTIALASKYTALPGALLLFLAALVAGRRERTMRLGALAFFAALAFFLVLPYGVASYRHGVTCLPGDGTTLDLTADFLPLNADAGRMGLVARTVYAWVSHDLALWGCRLRLGVDAFAPEWAYGGLMTGGLPGPAAALLWALVAVSLALPRMRRRAPTRVAWLLLAACFLVPLRYVGFLRYIPTFFAGLVLLAGELLLAVPPSRWRPPCAALGLACGAGFLAYALVLFIGQIRDEGIRRLNLVHLARTGAPCRLTKETEPFRYVLAEALAALGGRLDERPDAPPFRTEETFFPTGGSLLPRRSRLPEPWPAPFLRPAHRQEAGR